MTPFRPPLAGELIHERDGACAVIAYDERSERFLAVDRAGQLHAPSIDELRIVDDSVQAAAIAASEVIKRRSTAITTGEAVEMGASAEAEA
jgi:hypothetical protein